MSPWLIALIAAIVVVVVAIVVVLILDAPFLKAKIEERKFAKEQDVYEDSKTRKANRQVVFCDTKDLANQYINQKIKESQPVSREDLLEIEKAIKEKPYILANKDEDEVGDYEAIQAETVDKKVENLLKENDGIIIFE